MLFRLLRCSLQAGLSWWDIPSYIEPPALAKLLGVTLRRLVKDARKAFPSWWPQELTVKRQAKQGFSSVKELILNYEEAAGIACLYHRQPQRRMLVGSDLQRSAPPRLVRRTPCIAILGHKDHGKTTLLDSLRGTRMAEKEEFGITQETYSFEVALDEQTTDSERQRFLSSAPVAGRRAVLRLPRHARPSLLH